DQDRVNHVFSDLLSRENVGGLKLPFSGSAIADLAMKSSLRDPVAVLVLDAARYDLGCRLAELLNEGEPARRAELAAAMAPLPSITALGMPFTMPGSPN